MNDDKLKKYCVERNTYDKELARQNARNRLRSEMKKKLTTLLVGIISEFEKHFGAEWGHGLTNEARTDEQLDKLALWKIFRNNAFDLGHKQISGAEREIDNYIVEMNNSRYQYNFKKKDN